MFFNQRQAALYLVSVLDLDRVQLVSVDNTRVHSMACRSLVTVGVGTGDLRNCECCPTALDDPDGPILRGGVRKHYVGLVDSPRSAEFRPRCGVATH
jgi:hypothetical protein